MLKKLLPVALLAVSLNAADLTSEQQDAVNALVRAGMSQEQALQTVENFAVVSPSELAEMKAALSENQMQEMWEKHKMPIIFVGGGVVLVGGYLAFAKYKGMWPFGAAAAKKWFEKTKDELKDLSKDDATKAKAEIKAEYERLEKEKEYTDLLAMADFGTQDAGQGRAQDGKTIRSQDQQTKFTDLQKKIADLKALEKEVTEKK